VHLDVQRQILADLLPMVKSLSDHTDKEKRERPARTERRRKRRKSEHHAGKSDEDGDDVIMTDTAKPTAAISIVQKTRLPSERHLTVGINEVTKSLERQAKYTRHKLTVSDKGNITHADDIQPLIKFVFVCRADIDPPLLVAHLPHLVAACNSCVRDQASPGESSDAVKVVPLPKGAELSLAEAIGFRRVAVLALDVSCKHDFDSAYRVQKFRAPHQIFPT
jgi:ribonuclease P/MRP protein subunit POP3